MEYLENTALAGASRFCFGCEQLGGVDWGDVDVDAVGAAVIRARELGVNFFDTAAVYGLGASETRLCEILAGSLSGLTIATKGGLVFSEQTDGGRTVIKRDASRAALAASVKASRRRLGIERIPLYFVHWPDPAIAMDEMAESLVALRADGLIDKIGLSNFSLDQISAVWEFEAVDVVQLPFSLLDRSTAPIIEWCAEREIAVCAYGVLAQGLLTGKYTAESEFDESDRRHRLPHFSRMALQSNLETVSRVISVARHRGKSPAQVAIRFALQYPGISSVVVGSKTPDQLAGCIDVFEWGLSVDEINYLAHAAPS